MTRRAFLVAFLCLPACAGGEEVKKKPTPKPVPKPAPPPRDPEPGTTREAKR